MKNDKENIIKNIVNISIIIVVATLLSIFFLDDKINVLRDDGIQHVIRIQETAECIKKLESSKIYNNLCNGFGYSWDLFYGNFTSIIPAFIFLITGSSIGAFKIFLFILLVLSGISMYISCIKIFKQKEIGIIAAVIYMCAPYHLNDMYLRYAIAEFASFVFIPLVFAGLNSILKEEKNKDYLLLIIGTAGLIITHILSTVITAFFCLIFILVNYKKIKNINVIKKLLVSLLLILMISAYFWIPMLEATISTKYEVYEENKMSTVESVNKHRVEIKNLINSKENFQVHEIGIITIILVLLTIYSAKKVEKDSLKTYILFLIFGIFSIIMTTNIIDWEKMPKAFLMIQFPWRLLEFSTYFLSVIAGMNFYYALKKVKYIDILCIVIISLVFVSFLRYKLDYKETNIQEPKIGIVHEKSLSGTNAGAAKFEYLPKKAYKNIEYIANREEGIVIKEGSANIINYEKNGKKIISKIECETGKIVLELPFIYYIGYNIYVNDKEIPYQESDKGFIEIEINNKNKSSIEIETEYKGSAVMKISYIISICGIITFLIILIKKKKIEENKNEIVMHKNVEKT